MYLRAATDIFRLCEYHLYTPRTGEVDPFFRPEPSYLGGYRRSSPLVALASSVDFLSAADFSQLPSSHDLSAVGKANLQHILSSARACPYHNSFHLTIAVTITPFD